MGLIKTAHSKHNSKLAWRKTLASATYNI